MRKFEFFNGFTLIELLVAMGIFLTLSTVIFSIIVTVLRGAKKSDSIISVRQNGEYAIDQIVKTLRFAISLDYPNPIGGTMPACSSTGTIVQDVRITKVDLSQNIFSCPSSSNYPNYITFDGGMLTNSSNVVVKSCYFVCTQNIGEMPTIGIFFNLTKVNSSSLLEGDTSIPFQSAVTLRNIGG